MTRLTAVLVTSLLVAGNSLSAGAQIPSPASKPRRKPTTEPAAKATWMGSHSRITADGSVETAMPDGSKKLTRPGGCGYTIVFPDGKKSMISCAQVQPASPPLPDQVTTSWLDAHSAHLLEIIQALLGNDQESVDNYLRNDESATATVYDKIHLRTDLIAKLTNPQ